MDMKILNRILKKEEIYEFYSNEDDGSFDVGKPIKIYNEDILLQKISKDGNDNGLLAIKAAEIINVKDKTKYLFHIKNISCGNIICDVASNCNNAFDAVFNYAMKNDWNVAISFYLPFNNIVYGKCIYYDSNLIIIEEIDTKGGKDGITYIDIDNVVPCYCEN